MANKMQMTKDLSNKKLHITRSFNAPVKAVWRSFTEAGILDQWWGPQPYRAETKSMNFSEGGKWIYAMVGPEGDKQWCTDVFSKIDRYESYEAKDGFSDEHGNINTAMPSMHWRNIFEDNETSTTVDITISFSSEADLNGILEMGFEQGFATGLQQLEDLLKKQQPSLVA